MAAFIYFALSLAFITLSLIVTYDIKLVLVLRESIRPAWISGKPELNECPTINNLGIRTGDTGFTHATHIEVVPFHLVYQELLDGLFVNFRNSRSGQAISFLGQAF